MVPGSNQPQAYDTRAPLSVNVDSAPLPTLMGDDEVEQEIAARRDELYDPFKRAERPDPWPIIANNFPRIAEQIQALWGKSALDDYFARLVIDERGGRAGFPLEVLQAILEIARLHRGRFHFERPMSPWAHDVSETKWWDREGARSRKPVSQAPNTTQAPRSGETTRSGEPTRGGGTHGAETVDEAAIAREVQAQLENMTSRWPVLLSLPITPLRGADDLIRLEMAMQRAARPGGDLHRQDEIVGAVRVVLGMARARLKANDPAPPR
jgi:hypothetical protein